MGGSRELLFEARAGATQQTMGTAASQMRRGDSAAKYVVEEARHASTEELTMAFAEVPASERRRVMAALQSADQSADPNTFRSFRNSHAC